MPEKTFAEAAGLPEMNVEHEYTLLGQSNVKEISLALKELRAALDPEIEYVEKPGYSVTEDIANTLADIVVAKGGTAATGEFFNSMEAIAAHIHALAAVYGSSEPENT